MAAQIMPDLVLTSDVIVGFPGETEDEFEDTISLIEDVRYDALFTFIFSPRAGTPAAKMDDPTPKEEKNRRFDRLCDVQNRISLEIHQGYVGKTVRVLCRRPRQGHAHRPHRGRKTRPLRGRRQPDRAVFRRDDHGLHDVVADRRDLIASGRFAGLECLISSAANRRGKRNKTTCAFLRDWLVGADAHIGPADTVRFYGNLRRIRSFPNGPMWASAPTNECVSIGFAESIIRESF